MLSAGRYSNDFLRCAFFFFFFFSPRDVTTNSRDSTWRGEKNFSLRWRNFHTSCKCLKVASGSGFECSGARWKSISMSLHVEGWSGGRDSGGKFSNQKLFTRRRNSFPLSLPSFEIRMQLGVAENCKNMLDFHRGQATLIRKNFHYCFSFFLFLARSLSSCGFFSGCFLLSPPFYIMNEPRTVFPFGPVGLCCDEARGECFVSCLVKAQARSALTLLLRAFDVEEVFPFGFSFHMRNCFSPLSLARACSRLSLLTLPGDWWILFFGPTTPACWYCCCKLLFVGVCGLRRANPKVWENFPRGIFSFMIVSINGPRLCQLKPHSQCFSFVSPPSDLRQS